MHTEKRIFPKLLYSANAKILKLFVIILTNKKTFTILSMCKLMFIQPSARSVERGTSNRFRHQILPRLPPSSPVLPMVILRLEPKVCVRKFLNNFPPPLISEPSGSFGIRSKAALSSEKSTTRRFGHYRLRQPYQKSQISMIIQF